MSLIKSDNINELASALVKFQKAMPKIERSKTVSVGNKYSFDYAPLDAIVEKATPELTKHGLAVSQLVGEGGSVTTILMHESGQYIGSSITISATSNRPQDLGSAITYAKRYSYASILGIVAEDDDDASRAAGESDYSVKSRNGKSNQQDEKPWLNKTKYQSDEPTPEWQKVVSALAQGKAQPSDVRKKYKVAKELYEELEAIANGVPA